MSKSATMTNSSIRPDPQNGGASARVLGNIRPNADSESVIMWRRDTEPSAFSYFYPYTCSLGDSCARGNGREIMLTAFIAVAQRALQ